MSPKITGFGGVFIKSENPEKLRQWYSENLGLETDEYGTSFEWRNSETPDDKGYSVWSPFAGDTKYFEPSKKDFMLNFRVDNLDELLVQLKKKGIEVIGEVQKFEYGEFAHIIDPDGTKIELWEANDKEYERLIKGKAVK
jgi:predicted enzyme related to lactoylglutathione lyase